MRPIASDEDVQKRHYHGKHVGNWQGRRLKRVGSMLILHTIEGAGIDRPAVISVGSSPRLTLLDVNADEQWSQCFVRE
jgi:hypothetical protein